MRCFPSVRDLHLNFNHIKMTAPNLIIILDINSAAGTVQRIDTN